MTKRTVTTVSHPKNFSWLFRGSWFPLIFFPGLFFYVWLRIEPAVEQYSAGPVFFLGRSFFEPFAVRPGGLAEYAAIFLGHLSFFGWLGALVFALLNLLLFLGSGWILRQVAGVASIVPSMALLFLLLILRNAYGSPALTVAIGLILAMAAVAAWLVFNQLSLAFRLAASCFIAIVLFYLAGFWACLVFALLAGLSWFALGASNRSGFGAAASVLLGMVPCVIFLGLTRSSAASLLNPWDSKTTLFLVAALHALLPVAAGLALTLPRVLRPPGAPSPAQKRASHAAASRPGGASGYRSAAAHRAVVVLVLASGIVAVWFTFNEQRKARARIDYLGSRKEYARVLALGPALPVVDLSSQIRLHLALYHSGFLSSDLFAYAYPALPHLLPGILGGLPSCRAQSQTLLELGLISDAEHLAHEALEFEGNRPELLRTLALVNVLKGRPKAARVFLNVLNQVPFERSWAADCLRHLDASPTLDNDPEVARIRSCLLTNDFPHTGLPAEALLSRLLMTNPGNKMAFEYLLASYLLDLNLTNALGVVPFLDALGYQAIPRHLEEALLLHQHLNGALIDLRGRAISASTSHGFERFRDALTRLPDQGIQSRRILARDFGDTYWLYYVIKEADSKLPASHPPP